MDGRSESIAGGDAHFPRSGNAAGTRKRSHPGQRRRRHAVVILGTARRQAELDRPFEVAGQINRHGDRVGFQRVTAIVADVSFISLEKALPAALALAQPAAWLVLLVKPQFEVGRAGVGKGGIVRDEAAQRAAVERIASWLCADGRWRVLAPITSPIAGGSGNTEFLLGATCND